MNIERLKKSIMDKSERVNGIVFRFSLENEQEIREALDRGVKGKDFHTNAVDVFVKAVIEKDDVVFSRVFNGAKILLPTKEGYKFNGINYKFLSTYNERDGLTYKEKINTGGSNVYETPDLHEVQGSEVERTLTLKSGYKSIILSSNSNSIKIKVKMSQGGLNSENIFLFFYKVFGISPELLIEEVGDFLILNKYKIATSGKLNEKVVSELNLHDKAVLTFQEDVKASLLREFSFVVRCLGKVLAKDVAGYKRGVELTKEMLLDIEAQGITEIYIQKDFRKVKVINKDISSTYNLYINMLNYYLVGLEFGLKNDTNSMKSSEFVSVDESTLDGLERTMIEYKQKIITDCKIDSDSTDDSRLISNLSVSVKDTKLFARSLKDTIQKSQYQNLDSVSPWERVVGSGEITTRKGRDETNISNDKKNVMYDQICRICSSVSAESKKAGLNLHKTLGAQTTGRSFDNLYLDAKTGEHVRVDDISDLNIGLYTQPKGIEAGKVQVRNDLVLSVVDESDVDYYELSNAQYVGFTSGTIPFIGSNFGKRILMGANMSIQAFVPIYGSDIPVVSTVSQKMVKRLTVTAGELIHSNLSSNANTDDLLSLVDISTGNYKIAKFNCGLDFTSNIGMKKTIGKAREDLLLVGPGPWKDSNAVVQHYRGVKPNNHFKEIRTYDEEVVKELEPENYCSDYNLALGVDLKVLFAMKEYTYEDGIVISDRILRNKKLDVITIDTIKFKLEGSSTLSLPTNKASEYPTIGFNGLPKPGTVLASGDPVAVYKQKENGEHRIFRAPIGKEGIVVTSSVTNSTHEHEITISIIINRPVTKGDKLAGRHGNKGVIAKIVKEVNMPFGEDGKRFDMIISPLGIPSRMNIGQIFESVLGWCGYQLEERYVLEPFSKENRPLVDQKIKEAGYKKEIIYNPLTGKRFPREMGHGYMHIYRLKHTDDYNFNAMGAPDRRDDLTKQPVKKTVEGGGQKLGEMETWALLAHGAVNVLDELMSAHSDNPSEALKLNERLKRGESYNLSEESKSMSIYLLRNLFLMIGIDLQASSGKASMRLITDSILNDEISIQKIQSAAELKSKDIFGATRRGGHEEAFRKVAHVDLECEVIHPVALKRIHQLFIKKEGKTIKGFTEKDIEDIISAKLGIKKQFIYPLELKKVGKNTELLTGYEGLIYLLKTYDIQYTIKHLQERIAKTNSVSTREQLLRKLDQVYKFTQANKLKDLVLTKWPVVSLEFRKSTGKGRRESTEADFYNKLFKNIGGTDGLMNLLRFEMSTPEKRGGSQAKKTIMGKLKLVQKHSLLREQVLGKTIGWSGRGVIIPDPKLNYDQTGMPKMMAIDIYEEYCVTVVNELMRNPEYDTLKKLKTSKMFKSKVKKFLKYSLKDADSLLRSKFPDLYSEHVMYRNLIFEKLQEKLEDSWVILGRQPMLHQYSFRGFRPLLIDGNAIAIHPLSCNGYNADFDGDQMPVFAVFSEEAVEEVKHMSLAYKIINPKDQKSIIDHSQDMVAGIYWLTMYKDNGREDTTLNDVPIVLESVSDLKYLLSTNRIQPYQRVKLWDYEGHAGRLLFNYTVHQFSEGFKYNKRLGKSELRQITLETHKKYGDGEKTINILGAIMRLGFEYSVISGLSFTYEELKETNDKIKKSRESIVESHAADVAMVKRSYILGYTSIEESRIQELSIYAEIKEEVAKLIYEEIDHNSNLYIYINSGARGSESDLNDIMGYIGAIRDISGNYSREPVTGNYFEGLSGFEHFINSFGSREGLVSQSNSTGDAGYATRKLVYLSELKTVEEDCGSEGREITLNYVLDKRSSQKVLFGKLSSKDPLYDTFKPALGAENVLLMESIKYFNHYKPAEVILESGVAELKYTLAEYESSILINRTSMDERLGIDHIITREDIKAIDKAGWSSITIRDMLSCKSKNGVCQKCYGHLYDLGDYPEVGSPLAFKEAQAISEVATQQTLDKINSAGTELQSLDIDDLLKNTSKKVDSKLAPYDGIVSVNGKYVTIKSEEGLEKTYICPNAIVVNGQEVKTGDPIEEGIMNFNKYYTYTSDIQRMRDYISRTYFEILKESKVLPRGYEILALKQTLKGLRVNDIGIKELVDVSELGDGGQVIFQSYKEVNGNNVLTAILFEEIEKNLLDNAIYKRETDIVGFLSKGPISHSYAKDTVYDYQFKAKSLNIPLAVEENLLSGTQLFNDEVIVDSVELEEEDYFMSSGGSLFDDFSESLSDSDPIGLGGILSNGVPELDLDFDVSNDVEEIDLEDTDLFKEEEEA